MQTLSLISSLYRSEKHLPSFLQHVKTVLAEVNIPLEIVLVVNDATATERSLLTTVAQEERVQIIHCPRESLYASWNRGIAAAKGEFLGFWNVDDERTAAGLNTAHQLLSDKAEIVDFAYEIAEAGQVRRVPANFRPPSLNPRDTVAPFFCLRRSLYEQAGAFNPSFRIVGDYEWASRAIVQKAAYVASETLAGRFILHADNLSGGRNALEWVEFNMALVQHGAYQFLRPVEPKLMRQNWEAWGKAYTSMPAPLENWFWGQGAERRFKNYQAYQGSKWAKRFYLALNRLQLLPQNPFAAPRVE